jgi:hypothetical protein
MLDSMFRRPALSLLQVGLLLSCRTSGKEWVVLPEKEALVLMEPCSRPFPAGLSGYWKPDPGSLARAEARFQEAIPRALARVPKEERGFAPPVYLGQYAGFYRGGRHVIYVNAVGHLGDKPGASNMVEGWRTRALDLCDGGLLSFGAVFDVERDLVDAFAFNGTIGGPIELQEAAGDTPTPRLLSALPSVRR